ncbi:RES domain-containing protein [Shewanella algicola]|uniref:RES domain-containing protein n=1 Tax=Shewanella algicola TaxID=640633 RepID=UPI002493E9C6|nr:RES domain-containing protein [Shewanella algicola]
MQDFQLKKPDLLLFTDFPHDKVMFKTLSETAIMYRCYSATHEWMYYDSGPDGRFNGDIPSLFIELAESMNLTCFGTCYLSSTIEGALSESIFRNSPPFIEKSLLTSKKIVQVQLSENTTLKFINLGDAATRYALGIDTQIFSTPDYGVSIMWAHLFRQQGYNGIRYEGRNGQEICYALFDGSSVVLDDGEDMGVIGGDFLMPRLETYAAKLNVPIER